jgi:hypothetical protein
MAEQSPKKNPERPPWRTPLLVLEFGALAVLIGSMNILGRVGDDANPLSKAWLLIPALASLTVFMSFIGLMYLRWQASAEQQDKVRHKLTFVLLTLTMLGIWAFGIARTWMSMT